MARKKGKPLPYRRIRIKIKGRTRIQYFSNLSNRFIAKADISKNKRVQGFREAFPRRSEKTRRRIRKTIREYQDHGMDPFEASPGLLRLFRWLRKNSPAIYKINTVGLSKFAKKKILRDPNNF